MRFSRLFSLIALGAAVLVGAPSGAGAEADVGVIVMAESGSRAWQKSVTRTVKDAKLPYPYYVFFGAGDSGYQKNILQDYLRDLEDRGAHTVIVIPLAISPYSPVFRQWQYLFGVSVQPGFIATPLFPISKNSAIRFTEPLNDSAVVLEILLDRIQEISRRPADESVVIVTPGPADSKDNDKWLAVLKRLSDRLQTRGGYRGVEAATFRDDASSDERQQALLLLRKKVEAIPQAGGKALVVPLILSGGGIEHKISLELRGIPYSYNNKALLPDSRLSEWIRSQLP